MNEVARRVHVVMKLLCNRLDRQDILEFIAKQDKEHPDRAWNVCERSVDYYIKKANARLKEQRAYDRDLEFSKIVRGYNELYVKAKADKDYRACRSILKDLSDLYDMGKINLKVSGDSEAPLEIAGLDKLTVLDLKKLANNLGR